MDKFHLLCMYGHGVAWLLVRRSDKTTVTKQQSTTISVAESNNPGLCWPNKRILRFLRVWTWQLKRKKTHDHELLLCAPQLQQADFFTSKKRAVMSLKQMSSRRSTHRCHLCLQEQLSCIDLWTQMLNTHFCHTHYFWMKWWTKRRVQQLLDNMTVVSTIYQRQAGQICTFSCK